MMRGRWWWWWWRQQLWRAALRTTTPAALSAGPARTQGRRHGVRAVCAWLHACMHACRLCGGGAGGLGGERVQHAATPAVPDGSCVQLRSCVVRLRVVPGAEEARQASNGWPLSAAAARLPAARCCSPRRTTTACFYCCSMMWRRGRRAQQARAGPPRSAAAAALGAATAAAAAAAAAPCWCWRSCCRPAAAQALCSPAAGGDADGRGLAASLARLAHWRLLPAPLAVRQPACELIYGGAPGARHALPLPLPPARTPHHQCPIHHQHHAPPSLPVAGWGADQCACRPAPQPASLRPRPRARVPPVHTASSSACAHTRPVLN